MNIAWQTTDDLSALNAKYLHTISTTNTYNVYKFILRKIYNACDLSYDLMNIQKEFSDTKETIERASEASGAKKMLEDLAQKMRAEKQGGQGKLKSIEDFYIKSNVEIPGAVNKIVDALMKYAEKLKQKRMYYSAREQKWFAFDEEDKDKEFGEIERVMHAIQRLNDRPPPIESFNEHVKFALKNMIMGGIEG